MKFIIILVAVFVFGYIQTNAEGVSECYSCADGWGMDCDKPEIQKCPTDEDNICISMTTVYSDISSEGLKGCSANNPSVTEQYANFNRTGHGSYCYTCNENLCNVQQIMYIPISLMIKLILFLNLSIL